MQGQPKDIKRVHLLELITDVVIEQKKDNDQHEKHGNGDDSNQPWLNVCAAGS